MKIDNIDIEAEMAKARMLVHEGKHLSAATRSIVKILIPIISLLTKGPNLKSANSSKPPSNDPNIQKIAKAKTGDKPGRQKGRISITLQEVDNPD